MMNEKKYMVSPNAVFLVLLISVVTFLVFAGDVEIFRFIKFQVASAENGSDQSSGGVENSSGTEEKAETNDIDKEKSQAGTIKVRRELEGLEEKRLQIKRQEEKIKAEQARLIALKAELTDKIAELEDMHKKIEESLKKIEKKRSEKEVVTIEEQEKKIKQLVKMYSSMKPKQAGVIFNSMDIVVAEKILMNMKGDAAGQILAFVDGPRAALISERLSMNVSRSEGRP